MKKILILAIVAYGALIASTNAFALPYYDYMPVNVWLNEQTPNTTWTFNLNNDLLREGALDFDPVDINSEDVINSASLGIFFTDDDILAQEWSDVYLDSSFVGNYEIDVGLATANVQAYVVGDHTLRVDLHRTGGDFGVWYSRLSGDFTDNRPTAPVPEPASLSLLGFGILGLFGLKKKQ